MTELPDKLLDLIYDAATEHDLWVSVLTEIADLTNGQGGILIGRSLGAGEVHFDYNGRLSEECNRAYKERHIRNPWNEAMMLQPVGRVVFSDEVAPLSSLRPTLFFDEVLRPQDVAHNAMIALATKNDFQAAFNICRSQQQGPFGDDERLFLNRLVPHMRRSIQLGFRVDSYRELQRAGYDALDRLSAGIVLLDQQARILYINAAARSHESDGVLSLRKSTITTHSASYSHRLSELIRAVLRGMPTGSMSVPRPSDGQLLTIVLSSVRSKDIDRFTDTGMPDAAVLIFIVDPTNSSGVPIDWIVDAYGLTQAEARVALAASSGITIPEAAAQLGLSPNTIKTHLRKVFAKTGVNRQAELVRLMASIGLLTPKR